MDAGVTTPKQGLYHQHCPGLPLNPLDGDIKEQICSLRPHGDNRGSFISTKRRRPWEKKKKKRSKGGYSVTQLPLSLSLSHTHNHTNQSIKAEKWCTVVSEVVIGPSFNPWARLTRTSECTSTIWQQATSHNTYPWKDLATAAFLPSEPLFSLSASTMDSSGLQNP